ncbi:MAG: FtsX-like permease family protein, partial [Bacteroidales bacterium]
NPLQYYFVDEDLNRMYRDEKQNAQLALLFSLLAILIGTLGLFGMTSYTLAQRTREIGIRRTMGASVANIYLMISRETSVLVGIATLIAWSVVYIFLDKWLDNFQYKIGLSPIDFLAGFLIAFLIAFLTISYRTLKAANATPSVSLKYE